MHRSARREILLPAALFALTGVVFAWRVRHGMRFSTFGDESMHFVGAQVLSSGGILYRDFIELHGPLAYAIPQIYGAVFGWHEPLNARIIPVVLTLAAALCIACSACLESARQRLVAPALFLGLTSTVWLVQSLCLYDYQPVAGAMFVCAVALAAAPAWCGVLPGRPAIFLAGVNLGLVPFVAFSYAPASALFLASAAVPMQRRAGLTALIPLVSGVCAGCAAALLWMMMFADFRGYIVFHIIHALVDFGPYMKFGVFPALQVLVLPLRPENVVQLMGVAASVAGLAALTASGAMRRGGRVGFVLGVAGLIACNSRGSPGFQNGAFVLVAIGVLALGLARLQLPSGRGTKMLPPPVWTVCAAGLIAAGELAARHARSSPHGYLRADLGQLPRSSLKRADLPWTQAIRAAAAPGETMLAVPFDPSIYLFAGRPPMRRYVYYLPWDADYARLPWLGIERDLCADLAKDPPPVIYYNGWVVWGRYDPRDYMPCVLSELQAHYQRLPGGMPIYIRNDRMALVRSQ